MLLEEMMTLDEVGLTLDEEGLTLDDGDEILLEDMMLLDEEGLTLDDGDRFLLDDWLTLEDGDELLIDDEEGFKDETDEPKVFDELLKLLDIEENPAPGAEENAL
jgi:hypothetical protein